MPEPRLPDLRARRRRMVGERLIKVKKELIKRTFRPRIKNIEHEYFSAIARRIEATQRAFKPLFDVLENLERARRDAPLDDINRALAAVRAASSEIWKDSELEPLAGLYAGRMRSEAYQKFQNFVVTVTGSKYFLDPSLTQDTVRAHVAQNVSLIRSLPDRLFGKVEGIVFGDFRRGERHETTAKKIEEEFGHLTNNAELIARDQTQKLNAEINQIHQERVGIEEYIWRTAGDSRVREEHEEREGKTFRWDDPPEGGHPGEAVACRCFAEPVLV